MNGLTSFKNEIFKYGIAIAAVIGLASLPVLGLDAQFLYGLFLGTAIAIVNFSLMSFTFRLALEVRKGAGAIAFLGFLVRLAVYGIAFYMSVKVSLASGAGTALGFLSLKLALFYLHGLKPKFSKGKSAGANPPEFPTKKRRYDFNE
jgi:hypothetical protein